MLLGMLLHQSGVTNLTLSVRGLYCHDRSVSTRPQPFSAYLIHEKMLACQNFGCFCAGEARLQGEPNTFLIFLPGFSLEPAF